MAAEEKIDALPYEQVMERLDRIVTELEDGTLTLEEQIDRFAQGTRLVKRAQDLLDAAEARVEQLLGGDRTAPFAPAGEERPGPGAAADDDEDLPF